MNINFIHLIVCQLDPVDCLTFYSMQDNITKISLKSLTKTKFASGVEINFSHSYWYLLKVVYMDSIILHRYKTISVLTDELVPHKTWTCTLLIVSFKRSCKRCNSVDIELDKHADVMWSRGVSSPCRCAVY